MRRIPRVILLVESSRASGRRLLRGVADYARHHGPWAFLWEPGGLGKAWPRLRRAHADGVILRDTEAVDEVLAQGIPAVVVEHGRGEMPGVVNVVTESDAVGRLGAEHLIECGFRHFAFCGFEDRPWSRLRGRSFAERVARAGGETHFFTAARRARHGDEERALLGRWLRGLPKPVGVMAANDDRGQHVIEACKVSGLGVPDEVAVLGADDDELLCELSDPPMSSVAIQFERAGYEGARALDLLMAGERIRPRAILARALHVAARQSTDILNLDDPQLAKALKFIRQHGRESIRVDEVAVAAGLSRRVLENRFRSVLGGSVLGEIRRVRVDHIARMLIETSQTVSQIALALGYEGPEHIARYFRREKGMTPLAYRRKFARG